ncbi:reverse transcriptase domain-containing protein [Tanacetum coccineum]
MSTSNHPIIVSSDSDVKDAFSSTNIPDYTPSSPDYISASLGNTSPNPSDDLSKYLLASLAISPFHDDPYMKVMQAYNATNFFLPVEIQPPQKRACFLSSSSTDFSTPPQLPLERIEHMEDKIEGLGNGRSRDDHRGYSGLPPIKYEESSGQDPFLKPLYPELDNSLWIISQPLGSEPVLEKLNELDACEIFRSNCTEDCKVKLATGTLPEEALSWRNSFAQTIGIEEAYKITWSKFKKLLIKKYCPRTEVNKMEDKFYNLTVKGNDLMTYVRRFQELAILCPTMVPNSEKLWSLNRGLTQK